MQLMFHAYFYKIQKQSKRIQIKFLFIWNEKNFQYII